MASTSAPSASSSSSTSSSSSSSSSSAATNPLVEVEFVTKLPPSLSVPATPFSVPATLNRAGLNTVLNHLLGRDGARARPFDFVVHGRLLRSTLLDACRAELESRVTVEYIEALGRPRLQPTPTHDDWVSACATLPAAALGGGAGVLTASADCTLRVIDAVSGVERRCYLVQDTLSPLHPTLPIDSVCVLAGRHTLSTATATASSLTPRSRSRRAAERGDGNAAADRDGDGTALEVVTSSKDGTMLMWTLPDVPALDNDVSNAYSLDADDADDADASSAARSRIVKSSSSSSSSSSSTTGQRRALRIVRAFSDHDDAVTSVVADPSSSRSTFLASASWDTHVRVWSLAADDATMRTDDNNNNNDNNNDNDNDNDNDDARRKKTKRSAASASSSSAAKQEQAVVTSTSAALFSGHGQGVTALAWPTSTQLVSASWDRSVRVWDVESTACTRVLTSNKAINALACPRAADGGALATSSLLAVTGHVDARVRLWDMRAVESTATATMTAHRAQVVAVAWRPGSETHVVSSSHDQSSKVWDVRNTSVPLFTFTAHADRVLCNTWLAAGSRECIATGAADCKAALYEFPASDLTVE